MALRTATGNVHVICLWRHKF